MTYRLHYWPSIQGRGEFVRLILEHQQLEYEDVARAEEDGPQNVRTLMMDRERNPHGLSPPFLETDDHILSQMPAICHWLASETSFVASQNPQISLQFALTIGDVVAEVHDTHHPLGSSLYFEEQTDAAKTNARQFLEDRLPRFLSFFESSIENGHVMGTPNYLDLMLFQLIGGLRYAFPNCMRGMLTDHPRLETLAAEVADLEVLSDYLHSDRRIPFNEDGIFRHYAALDMGRQE